MTTWRPLGPSRSEQDPRRITDSLNRIAGRLGGPRPEVVTAVFAGWEGLVGADIAAHARPVSLRDGVLVLAVDHPVWAAQLRYMTADVLTRLSEGTGGADVSEIHIKVTGEEAPRRGLGRRPGKAQ